MHPYLLHFGHLSLPTYGVLAAVGLMCALGLSQYTAARTGVDPDAIWDAGLFAIVAAYVSSRLLLLVTNLQSFLAYPAMLLAVPSLTATGLLLTGIATVVWLRMKRVPLLGALDAWAPCATLLWVFLALGHFAEGSDPGMATGLLWGIRMPGETTPLHPVALYVAVVAAVLTVMLYRWPRASLALVTVGTAQYFLSFVRQPGVEAVAGLDALQFVALGMVVAGCCLGLATSEPAKPAMMDVG